MYLHMTIRSPGECISEHATSPAPLLCPDLPQRFINHTSSTLKCIHRCPIDAMALATAPPSRLGLTSQQPYAHDPPPSPGTPLVYIAASQNEVGLWDLSQGHCRQVLHKLSKEETEMGSADIPVSLQGSSNGLSRGNSGTSRNGLSRAASGRADGLGFSGAGFSDGVGRVGVAGRGEGVSGVDLTQLASEMASHLAVDQINSPQVSWLHVPAGCRLGMHCRKLYWHR